MSDKIGEWYDGRTTFPPEGEMVLCVRESKKGNRSLCFGTHWHERPWDNGWVTSGACNNILYWMHLPKIPGGDTK